MQPRGLYELMQGRQGHVLPPSWAPVVDLEIGRRPIRVMPHVGLRARH